MNRRGAAAALSTAVLLGVLTIQPAARATTPTLDTPDDVAAALKYEARMLDHLHYGQIYEQEYRTADRIAGDIRTTEGENDSALYTGNYLGGESFRYALAKSKIAKGIDVAFWTGQ